jgi:hypothetical protein
MRRIMVLRYVGPRENPRDKPLSTMACTQLTVNKEKDPSHITKRN